jgi:hypothetical protein
MGSKIIGAFVALSIGGSVAWAASTGPPAGKPPKGPGYGYEGGKVTLCHKTDSSGNASVTITVSQNAVEAHLRHGDTLGPC